MRIRVEYPSPPKAALDQQREPGPRHPQLDGKKFGEGVSRDNG
jgi:hypothetical protein